MSRRSICWTGRPTSRVSPSYQSGTASATICSAQKILSRLSEEPPLSFALTESGLAEKARDTVGRTGRHVVARRREFSATRGRPCEF